MEELKGRIALVTGASRGIGRAMDINARALLPLSQHASKGQTIVVDGGYAIRA